MSNLPTLHIGHPVWLFDENCRSYRYDAKGNAVGGPIWRNHWRKHIIMGESRVSWVIGYASGGSTEIGKIPKKDPYSRGRFIAFSEADIERRAWIVENRHKICDFISSIDDYYLLREIEKLSGYVPRPT